jgi:hypothetical protein
VRPLRTAANDEVRARNLVGGVPPQQLHDVGQRKTVTLTEKHKSLNRCGATAANRAALEIPQSASLFPEIIHPLSITARQRRGEVG